MPVNDKLERLLRDADHNLVDQRANDALACRRCRTCAVPGPFEIGTERQESLAVLFAQDASGTAANVSRSSSSARAAKRRSFQRRSSSPATSRLSGSTA